MTNIGKVEQKLGEVLGLEMAAQKQLKNSAQKGYWMKLG
jgi:hypothetical protein